MAKNGLEENVRDEIRQFIYKALEKDDDLRLTTALYKQWLRDGGKAQKREREVKQEDATPSAPSKVRNWTDGWQPKCLWCKELGHWESKCPSKKAGKPKKN